MEASGGGPPQMPVDAILAEDSVAAGVAALEQIHGRHLADMTAEEQAEARDHWRRQVEEVLAAVRAVHAGPGAPGVGRAVITFSDAGDERVDVSVSFQPDLEELSEGQVAGTAGQGLGLPGLASLRQDVHARPIPQLGGPGRGDLARPLAVVVAGLVVRVLLLLVVVRIPLLGLVVA